MSVRDDSIPTLRQRRDRLLADLAQWAICGPVRRCHDKPNCRRDRPGERGNGR